MPLLEGVVDILEKLNQDNYFLVVATGKSRKGLDRSLTETGLTKYFHTTRCADESISKPDPQMLIEIIEFFGLEAPDALMIGDSEYDLKMANNGGASRRSELCCSRCQSTAIMCATWSHTSHY